MSDSSTKTGEQALSAVQQKVLKLAAGFVKRGMISEVFELMEAQFSQPTTEVLDFLTDVLEDTVNKSDPLVKSNADTVLKLVRNWRNALRDLASTEQSKPSVGKFLVACLRCVNFAKHDAKLIVEFHSIMLQCSFTVTGDPQGCVNGATFGDLAYSPYSKEIRMTP